MQLKEFLARLDEFSDAEREVYIGALLEQLTEVSVRTMLGFQAGWVGDDMDAFKRETNAELRQCITLEQSELGHAMRAACELEPLTEETQIG